MTDQALVQVSVLQELDLCHAKIRELVSSGKIPPMLAIRYYHAVLRGLECTIANTESIATLFVSSTNTRRVTAMMQAVCELRRIWLVKDIEFSCRTANCFENAQIQDLYQLVGRTEAQLLLKKNFGKKSLKEVQDFLRDHQLRLGMTDEQIIEWCLQQW